MTDPWQAQEREGEQKSAAVKTVTSQCRCFFFNFSQSCKTQLYRRICDLRLFYLCARPVQGDYAAARMYYERALLLSPGSKLLKENLAKLDRLERRLTGGA